MGEQSYTLHDARAALSKALDAGDYPPEWATRAVIEATTEGALLQYVRTFVVEHVYWEDQLQAVDAEDVDALLAGLAELRPPVQATDKTPALVRDTLTKMQGLPWSGDHLYGDALYDAVTILKHVLSGGKGWPVLERFRCPSVNAATGWRCEKQLPHDTDHSSSDLNGKGLSWTDEGCTNPPKPCDSAAEELSGHPVRKVDRLQRCAEWQDVQGQSELCRLLAGHNGPHSYEPPAAILEDHLCAAFRTTAGLTLRCELDAGHIGDHRDNGAMGTWI